MYKPFHLALSYPHRSALQADRLFNTKGRTTNRNYDLLSFLLNLTNSTLQSHISGHKDGGQLVGLCPLGRNRVANRLQLTGVNLDTKRAPKLSLRCPVDYATQVELARLAVA